MSGKELKIQRKNGFSANIFFKKFGTLCVLVLMLIICIIIEPAFLSVSNIFNIFKQICVVAIIACGETMLIIEGQIDLGAGSVVALCGCVAVQVYVVTRNVFLAVLACLVVAALTGLINGFLVTRYKLPAFIATLAMMNIARGSALIVTDGSPIALNTFDSSGFKFMGQATIGPVPMVFIVMVIIYLITWLLLAKLPLGRHIYAIGGNEEAAFAAGVNVKRTKMITYTLAGLFSGIGGFLLMSRLNVGNPTLGEGYEFDAITGAILGGVSFSGGVGSVLGTLIGSLILGVMNNILNLAGVSAYIQTVVKGIIIIIAVILDVKSKSIGKK